MWLKLDNGFAFHPKVVAAGPLALAIQVRAFCYTSQHLTDGFIPTGMMTALTAGLEPFCSSSMDWGAYMIEKGLWDACDGGYQLHDYLDWNPSKKSIEILKKHQSAGGKKAMKQRWSKGLTVVKSTYKSSYKSTNKSPSISISTLNSLNSPESGEPDWFLELKKNPLYAHIDFVREVGKMQEWNSRPENVHRQLTRKFMVNWLNKIEPPLILNGKSSTQRPPPPPPKNDPIGRGQWGRTYGDPKEYGYD